MTNPAAVTACSIKVSVPISDADFPIGVIPAKGVPGSAKMRVRLNISTPDGLQLTADPAAKNLQRALEAAQAAPGGFWVAQGKLAPGGVLAEAGVIYQPPSKPNATLTAVAE